MIEDPEFWNERTNLLIKEAKRIIKIQFPDKDEIKVNDLAWLMVERFREDKAYEMFKDNAVEITKRQSTFT